MPIYPYTCKCGKEEDVLSTFKDLVDPYCTKCGLKMERDYSRQKVRFNLVGLGWARDGYNTDIDDAEEQWKKDGKPTGYWVGNWCPTDPRTGKAKIDRSHIKSKNKITFSSPFEVAKDGLAIGS